MCIRDRPRPSTCESRHTFTSPGACPWVPAGPPWRHRRPPGWPTGGCPPTQPPSRPPRRAGVPVPGRPGHQRATALGRQCRSAGCTGRRRGYGPFCLPWEGSTAGPWPEWRPPPPLRERPCPAVGCGQRDPPRRAWRPR
eukprot:5794554-Alexandrium_andersonii.AAC.2